MSIVYKFETFETFLVDNYLLDNVATKDPYWPFYNSYENNQLFSPVPKNIKIDDLEENKLSGYINPSQFLSNPIPSFNYQSVLYVHSNCTLPRAKITQKYKRVLKPDAAHICVVPTITHSYRIYQMAIFANREANKVFIIQMGYRWSQGQKIIVGNDISYFATGSKITDINPNILKYSFPETDYFKMRASSQPRLYTYKNWVDLLDSSLVYYGPVLVTKPQDRWVSDCMYNKMHDIISETALLSSLEDKGNDFCKEIYDNIVDMLNSKDLDTIGLGLRAIAELNYKKYYNTTLYLLNNASQRWRDSPIKYNVSVKYMLKYLGVWNYRSEKYTTETTQEDFDMMNSILLNEFNKTKNNIITEFQRKYPFTEVDFSSTLHLIPKLISENNNNSEEPIN